MSYERERDKIGRKARTRDRKKKLDLRGTLIRGMGTYVS
jgi:hypothetical protein